MSKIDPVESDDLLGLINRILNHSFVGCEHGCLCCGEANKIASEIKRRITPKKEYGWFCEACGCEVVKIHYSQNNVTSWRHNNGCKRKRITCGQKPIPEYRLES